MYFTIYSTLRKASIHRYFKDFQNTNSPVLISQNCEIRTQKKSSTPLFCVLLSILRKDFLLFLLFFLSSLGIQNGNGCKVYNLIYA